MKIKVFFNNSCYVCRKEINHYKNICKDNFNWIDINNNQTAKKLTSKSFKELLRRIHVIENNKVISGAEAFLIIWKNIPRLNFLYKIFKIKPLFLIFFVMYEVAALILFLKNQHLLNRKWKKNIYHLSFVLFVKKNFTGERNGNVIGKTWSIVQKNVLVTSLNFCISKVWFNFFKFTKKFLCFFIWNSRNNNNLFIFFPICRCSYFLFAC